MLPATEITAEITLDGLFLNADAGLDSEPLPALSESKDIVANIVFNPRDTCCWDSQQYFDAERYQSPYPD